jgi:hypothetical protein
MKNSKHVKLQGTNLVFLANDNFTSETEINRSTVDTRKSSDFPQVNESSTGIVPVSNKPIR